VLRRLITLLAQLAVPAYPRSLFFLDLPLNILLDGSILLTPLLPRPEEGVLGGLPSSSAADCGIAEYDVAISAALADGVIRVAIAWGRQFAILNVQRLR
jgi:hypothetical protein